VKCQSQEKAPQPSFFSGRMRGKRKTAFIHDCKRKRGTI